MPSLHTTMGGMMCAALGREGRMNASERAYRSIKEQILSGSLTPGAWLREGELGSTIGVSRTPVREALRRLGVEGYVRFEPNRGAFVTESSARELREMLELRSTIEPFAARLAAERITPEHICRLQELASEMEAAGGDPDRTSMDAITALNTEFHNLVALAADNRRLIDIRNTIGYLSKTFRTFDRYTPAKLQRSFQHHRELIEALQAHDGRWAASVMSSHVLAAQSVVRAADEFRTQSED